MVKEITSKAEFESEVASGKVLVDFNAIWCGPCRMLAPILEKVSENPSLKVLSVDVDHNPDVAAMFRVNSIPFLVLFEDGKVTNTSLGYIPEPNLKKFAKID